MPPAKKKLVDAHPGNLVTGPKHSNSGQAIQHTDLQNESTILRHKYPPVVTQSIDQHLASVKEHGWGANYKKPNKSTGVQSNAVKKGTMSTSVKGAAKTGTPKKPISQLTSTRPNMSLHPIMTEAQTSPATTSPNKLNLDMTGPRFYRSWDDISGKASKTWNQVSGGASNAWNQVSGVIQSGAQGGESLAAKIIPGFRTHSMGCLPC